MILLPFIFPLLLPPLAIGAYLFRRPASSPLLHFVALMTLKPLFATPFWLYVIQLSVTPDSPPLTPNVVLEALPGISLTLLIVWTCRADLKGQSAGIIITLLILDTVRWGSTVLSQPLVRPVGSGFPLLLSMSMPTAYSIVAWFLSRGLISVKTNRDGIKT